MRFNRLSHIRLGSLIGTPGPNFSELQQYSFHNSHNAEGHVATCPVGRIYDVAGGIFGPAIEGGESAPDPVGITYAYHDMVTQESTARPPAPKSLTESVRSEKAFKPRRVCGYFVQLGWLGCGFAGL